MIHPYLEIQDIAFHYGRGFQLEIPQLEIRRGEFIFILGLNGSGKTTFLKLLSNLLKPEKGAMLLEGKNLRQLKPKEYARKISLVEQNASFAFPYTVYEMVAMGRFAHQEGNYFETTADAQALENLLRQTQVWDFRNAPIDCLSGGEKKRVEITQALAQESEILLLDEPTSSLDILQEASLMQLLETRNSHGKTICFTTHRLDLATRHATRVLLFRDGKIAKDWLLSKKSAPAPQEIAHLEIEIRKELTKI